ncbi:Prefoldin beta-like protein [Pavlovales sp. CCMP2436]|nr:Prefoldin beta-like protein [Pavlovales sp. CCMP2436]
MPSDEEDQVSSADQQKINQFSRLNGRLHEIGEELDIQRKAVDELNDLGDELILLDDDEPIKYNFGECYLEVTKDRAEKLIENLLETKNAALSVTQDELAQCKSTLQDLKNQLYARFGTNINLEE